MVRTHLAKDNFRCQLFESNAVVTPLSILKGDNCGVRESGLGALAQLAKYGELNLFKV